MRDVERLREKHQLSLDDRQVAALGLCALILLAAVFGLGVTLGRRLSLAAPAQGPALLPQLDDSALPSRKAAAEPPRAAVPAAARAPIVVPAPPKPLQVASALSIAPLAQAPAELGAYTVQLGASRDKGDAQRLEAKARAAGLKPYVVNADLGRRGLWYRVRVGSFPDKETANRYRKDVERELRSSAVVMATR